MTDDMRVRFIITDPFPDGSEWVYDRCPSLDVAYRWLFAMADLTRHLRPALRWNAIVEARHPDTGEWEQCGTLDIDDSGLAVIG